MCRNQAFTKRETITLTIIIVVILLVGIPVAMNFAGPSHSKITENMARIRGIHFGMILYAQGNSDRYPGLKSDGDESNP